MEASFGEYIGRLVGFLCRWPVAGIQHGWKKEEEKKKKKYVKLLKYSNRTFFFVPFCFINVCGNLILWIKKFTFPSNCLAELNLVKPFNLFAFQQ